MPSTDTVRGFVTMNIAAPDIEIAYMAADAARDMLNTVWIVDEPPRVKRLAHGGFFQVRIPIIAPEHEIRTAGPIVGRAANAAASAAGCRGVDAVRCYLR